LVAFVKSLGADVAIGCKTQDCKVVIKIK